MRVKVKRSDVLGALAVAGFWFLALYVWGVTSGII